MKQSDLLLLILAFTSFTFSQGMLGEIGFNESYHQNLQANMVVTEDYSYFIMSEIDPPYFMASVLVKVDKSGNIIYKKTITPNVPSDYGTAEAEINYIYHMAPTPDGGLIIVEYATELCDVDTGNIFQVRKLNQHGNQLWATSLNDADNYVIFNELRVRGNEVFISTKDTQEKFSFFLINASNGAITNSFENNNLTDFSNFDKLGSNYYGIINNSGIAKLSSQGQLQSIIPGTSTIKQFEIIGNNFFTIGSDKAIRKYDSNFNELASFTLDDNEAFILKLKQVGSSVQLLSLHTDNPINGIINNFKISSLTNNLVFQSAKTFNMPDAPQLYQWQYLNFSSTHAGIGIDHSLANEYSTVRYVYYSLTNENDIEIERIDVEIVELETYDVTIVHPENAPENLYHVKFSAKAKIKNNSSYTLETVIFNRYITWADCHDYVYFYRFTDLNIPPGGTDWIDLGIMHNDLESLQSTDDIASYNFCVVTCSPNDLADIVVENDKLCQNVTTYVGLDEEVITSSTKKLVKIVNQLGQEIKEEPGRLLIYIFDDGSSEKRIIIP